MLKIFVSSTYRDLAEHRGKLLKEIDDALDGIGMENFVPDGSDSQQVCIGRLKDSEVVIFLLSPYYGSLMQKCSIMEDCKAECPMKTGEGKISYTHCEYKTTLADGIQHQTYLVTKGWDELWALKDTLPKKIKIKALKKKPFFSGMSDDLINHYIRIHKEACQFQQEVGKEYYSEINDIENPENIVKIKSDLAENLLKWYSKEKINFVNFVDRRDELKDLIENIDDRVEVHGVGGVGKTSLIQIALLIEKLKGKKVITVGPKPVHAGSGYEYFKKKLKEFIHRISNKKEITLDDIINAFGDSLPNISGIPKEEQIDRLAKTIESERILLFIDDVFLANDDVKDFINATDNLVLSSRYKTGLARKEIVLVGIAAEDRKALIDLLSQRYNIKINPNIKQKIEHIAEGHPISTEMLVKNYDRIDFSALKEFKLSDFVKVEDYLNRIVKEILSDDAFALVNDLSVINAELDNNIDRDTLKRSSELSNFIDLFNELLDTKILKSKEHKPGKVEFSFKHVQEALSEIVEKSSHEKAIKYYKSLESKIGKNIDNDVEIYYHQLKSNPTEDLADEFVNLANRIRPDKYGFNRLISVGEEMRESFQELPMFQHNHKATILKTLGKLYLDSGRYERAETRFLNAANFLDDIDDLINQNVQSFLSANDNLLLEISENFMRNYLVYLSAKESIDVSPWKELGNKVKGIIKEPKNKKIKEGIRQLFTYCANIIGYNHKKLYFFEAQEIAEVLFEKKPEINDILDACAVYDQLRWMASIIDESDKELSLRTADLYEQYAVEFKRVKRKLSAEDAKNIRPYIKVLESAAWHYQLGDEFIKSAEKYVEINKSELEKLSVGMQKFMLWMAALNFDRGNEKNQSTEQYIKLSNLLIETQGISELAAELYKKALDQMDESSKLYNKIKEKYQKADKEFDILKEKCEKEGTKTALLVSNIYDKVAADGVASFLYKNNINCFYDVHLHSQAAETVKKNNGKYDYIILHGGSLSPHTGHLTVKIFGQEKDFAKLFQTKYSYGNVWTLQIDNEKTEWVLIAGNGAETTLEAVDTFKRGNYL